MSVDSVGFSAWETLPANTMLRVTLNANTYFFDVTATFPKAAQSIVDQLYPVARLIPSTRLSLLSTDKTAAVDGIIHNETRGADLLNRLESLGSSWAFVSRVERLSSREKADSSSDAGAQEREEAALAAKKASDAGAWYRQLLAALDTAGTVVKWGAIIAGVTAVAYLAHEFQGNRK